MQEFFENFFFFRAALARTGLGKDKKTACFFPRSMVEFSRTILPALREERRIFIMRTLRICGADLSAFRIVIPSDPAPAVRFAKTFLESVIARSCGFSLPDASGSDEHRILIGTEPPSAGVRWDGFRIRTDGANVYLDGAEPRGTLFAVYDFCERYLGYRKFSSDTEVFSTEGEAELPAGTERIDNPTFEERRCDWFEFQGDPELCSHSRVFSLGKAIPEDLGGQPDSPWECHTMWKFCPGGDYFEEHPDYYSLWRETRVPCNSAVGPGMPCLTHPDVIRIAKERALSLIREHPERRILDVSQVDGDIYCTCERCAAVNEAEGSPSGTLIRFINEIAEAVEREFPDVLVQTFAYLYSAKPPILTRARRNVLIRYCTMQGCFRHAIDDPACEKNRETVAKELRGWTERCDQMCIWDYVTNWYSFLSPYPNLISLRENVRFYDECQVRVVFCEDLSNRRCGGLHPELRAYLIGKVLWNAHLSEEEYNRHIDEFLEAYYGKGWKAFRRIIELEHELTRDRHISDMEEVDLGYLHWMTDPPLPGIKRLLHRNYRPGPYQPALPGSPLEPLVDAIDSLKELMDECEAGAETDLQRDHVRRARFALSYQDLFCRKRNREAMTYAQQQDYEEQVREFYRIKEEYRASFNLNTIQFSD